MNKNAKRLERYFKGSANHRRIEILILLNNEPNLSLEEVAGKVSGNLQTIAAHLRKLFQSGLINKKYVRRNVIHTLSPYGRKFIKFFTTL